MFIYILTHVCDDPGLPRWLSEEESACQRRRHSFHPWSGKIPHASKQVNRWATAIKAVLWRPWSWCPTRGAATVRKPNAAAKSGPHSLPPGKQTKNKSLKKKKQQTGIRLVLLMKCAQWWAPLYCPTKPRVWSSSPLLLAGRNGRPRRWWAHGMKIHVGPQKDRVEQDHPAHLCSYPTS